MTERAEIEDLRRKVAALEGQMALLKPWLSVMYADMLKLQFSAAKAMKGDREAANALFKEVQKNAEILAAGDQNE